MNNLTDRVGGWEFSINDYFYSNHYHNYEVNKMKEFIIVNLLNGIITIVIAKSVLEAIKKGQRYFSEPNRNKVPVQVLN